MLNIYAVFKYWWEGDGSLVKELQENSLSLRLESAIMYATNKVNQDNERLKEKYQKIKDRIASVHHTTEKPPVETYVEFYNLGDAIPNHLPSSWGHTQFYTIEKLEVLQ